MVTLMTTTIKPSSASARIEEIERVTAHTHTILLCQMLSR
jgi:hypothetical protein